MSSYRCMRTILFFDLPVVKARQRKMYARFVKSIKKLGFVMMQESVYCKMDLDDRAANSTKKDVSKILPKEGYVALLKITEKQFASIEYLLGENPSDVINDDSRVVVL